MERDIASLLTWHLDSRVLVPQYMTHTNRITSSMTSRTANARSDSLMLNGVLVQD